MGHVAHNKGGKLVSCIHKFPHKMFYVNSKAFSLEDRLIAILINIDLSGDWSPQITRLI